MFILRTHSIIVMKNIFALVLVHVQSKYAKLKTCITFMTFCGSEMFQIVDNFELDFYKIRFVNIISKKIFMQVLYWNYYNKLSNNT